MLRCNILTLNIGILLRCVKCFLLHRTKNIIALIFMDKMRCCGHFPHPSFNGHASNYPLDAGAGAAQTVLMSESGHKKGKPEKEEPRATRLATALRANLARRKQQQRGRASDQPGAGQDKGKEDG